jgi:hypothetical protein
VADADGLYDPTAYHDRGVLGLRGMRHEAALSLLTGRRHEGRRKKATRGELLQHPPRGEVRGSDGDAPRDPAEQARQVGGLICAGFEPHGSVPGLLRSVVAPDRGLPMRPHRGVTRGPLAGHRPTRMPWQTGRHHPIYAGA